MPPHIVTVKHKGNFNKIEKFLYAMRIKDFTKILQKYGQIGVEALQAATPVDTGKTANSWGYEISKEKGIFKITWTNSNINRGVNIALILQYGHATRNGGYVQGIDYINPALKDIFDKMAEDAWQEVTSS